MVVSLSRINYLGREVRVIHRVGELLGLQAQSRVSLIDAPSFPLDVLDHVPCVELHPGLVRGQLHHPSRSLVVNDCCLLQGLASLSPVEDVVDVEALRQCRDLGPNRVGLPEIVWGPLDGSDLPGRDQMGVDGGDVGREDSNLFRQDVAAAVTSQVPVRVLGQVHGGRLVYRLSPHGHAQFVVTRERVGDRDS